MIDLKGFRKDKNIKQRVICELLDIAQPYLSAIERGERPLSKNKITILHNHFGDIILNYKKADIIIERKSIKEPSLSNSDDRSRFLTIIENLQKTIEYQQRMLDSLQGVLHTKNVRNKKDVEELDFTEH